MQNTLSDLPVLIIDCQTTGNHPRNSHVLEIGWMSARAGDPVDRKPDIEKTLMLRLPSGQKVPKAVQKLTGIQEISIETATAPEDAWHQLTMDARSLAAGDAEAGCPAVIHFARFETAFLEAWHREFNGSTGRFPLDIVCTHQIAARLLSGLPRKGLRAVAGYFGCSVPPAKRCGVHLKATAAIWHHVVPLLEAAAGVATWEQLRTWLVEKALPRQPARVYPMPRRIRLDLPDEPGIYRFLRSNGDVLYIGKARSLRRRVNSYFQGNRRHSEKNLEMLSQAVDIQYVRTHSAVEAAYLESSEIKIHTPPYNEALAAGNRALVFFSSDFNACARQPNALCRLGPVPSEDPFLSFRLLGEWLQGRVPDFCENLASRLLGMSTEYCPDRNCLMDGLAMFKARFEDDLRRQETWRGLVSIGRLAWKERMAQLSADDCTVREDEDQGSRDEPEFTWSPEAVARALASRLRRGAHLLRRARWLTMLTESSIAWQASASSSGRRQVMVFQHGRLIACNLVEKHQLPPVPPGYSLPLAERKAHLDIAVYDGLRVVTTELRRLSADNRQPAVRLKPGVVLGPDRLQILLKWI